MPTTTPGSQTTARLERSGGPTPRALSENTALAWLDAKRSRAEIVNALTEALGGLTVSQAAAIDTLFNQAMADEYEAGYAAGYQAGYGVGHRDGVRYDPATAPFLS